MSSSSISFHFSLISHISAQDASFYLPDYPSSIPSDAHVSPVPVDASGYVADSERPPGVVTVGGWSDTIGPVPWQSIPTVRMANKVTSI